jgi:ADP-heptose:LPS heptosyltransferase
MTIPAVKGIRNKFPDAHISWLVEGPVAEFLACQDFIDETIIFPRGGIVQGLKKGNMFWAKKAIGPFLKNLRKREYDLVVDFHGIAKSALFSMLARGTRKIGFGDMFAKEKSHFFYHNRINGSDKRMHKVERNMLLANHLGYTNAVPQVTLNTSDEAMEYIDKFFLETGNAPPLFAVNPFSSKGTDFKRWPMERYAELIARIHHELREQTVILGAAFDEVILYQDAAQRGRADGEVMALLRHGLQGAQRTTRIDEIRGEFAAIDTALERLQPGDLCLVLVDQVQQALDHLARRLGEG